MVFPHGGLVVMRRKSGDRLVFDAGPHGPKRTRAVHSHADALAIDLTVAGVPLLVDPGTFTYVTDPTERDRLRLASSHNTLTVDHHSSSEPDGPFSWRRTTDALLEAWCSDPAFAYARGSHAGLVPELPATRHIREVLQISDLGWLVRDRVRGAVGGAATLHFHAAPGCRVEEKGPGARLLYRGDVGLMLAWAGVDGVKDEEDWVSRLYGKRERAPVIRAFMQANPSPIR